MSDDDLAALAGPIGLGPDEKVPNPVRILAAHENLGRLHSVHRPTRFLSRLKWGGGQLHVYDQGLVLALKGGGTRLFLVGRMRMQSLRPGRTFMLLGHQGPGGFDVRGWSDGEALGEALGRWLPSHPWR